MKKHFILYLLGEHHVYVYVYAYLVVRHDLNL